MGPGNDFRQLVDAYIRKAISGGVPSLFSDLKALYDDSSKRATIEEVVLHVLAEEEAAPGESMQSLNAQIRGLTFQSVPRRARTANNSGMDSVFPGPTLRYFAKYLFQSNRVYRASHISHTNSPRTVYGARPSAKACRRLIRRISHNERGMAPRPAGQVLEHQKRKVFAKGGFHSGGKCHARSLH